MSASKLPPEYMAIIRHYEVCFEKHGPTHRGADWPNAEDLAIRFEVMLGVVRDVGPKPASLLDLGCGPALLLDFLRDTNRLEQFNYQGIDLSPAMITAANTRWPGHHFECRDILSDPMPTEAFDYVIMNGVLTEKVGLTQEVMSQYAQRIIASAYDMARVGIAFNVMSAHVDWQRDDLFHWPFDEMAAFLKKRCSRHFMIRADYGLYEYTVYVYRHHTNLLRS
jgi:SAM-dependent methyltransferase